MIDAGVLNRAGISYEAGMSRFMGDAELYEAVLTAFLDEDIQERAEAAYAAKDIARFQEVIHEAKGVGGSAGLDRLYAEASTLMKLLRGRSFAEDELAIEYERFVKAYTAARDGIRAALGK